MKFLICLFIIFSAPTFAKTCKSNLISSNTQVAKGPLSSIVAKRRARKNWRQKVRNLYGKKWSNFSRANDKWKQCWGPSGTTLCAFHGRPCKK